MTERNYIPILNKIIDQVETTGWAFMPVFGNDMQFCYTIGLWQTFKHPEVIILGLPIELSCTILNDVGHTVKDGFSYQEDKNYNELFESQSVILKSVDKTHYEYYFGIGERYYGSADFPSLQLFWPDTQGNFPWNSTDSNFKEWQPDLSSPELTKAEVEAD